MLTLYQKNKGNDCGKAGSTTNSIITSHCVTLLLSNTVTKKQKWCQASFKLIFNQACQQLFLQKKFYSQHYKKQKHLSQKSSITVKLFYPHVLNRRNPPEVGSGKKELFFFFKCITLHCAKKAHYLHSCPVTFYTFNST